MNLKVKNLDFIFSSDINNLSLSIFIIQLTTFNDNNVGKDW